MKWLERGWPILRRSIERIETLVLNLLTFSRDRQPQIMPTDLNGLIEEVIEVVRQRAEAAKAAFQFVRGEIGIVYIDGREIYRVILNLLTNAVDACEEKGGTITVTTRREPTGCYFDISDTGSGIPPEIMPRLSQAFVSTKGSRGTGPGTGVQLQNCAGTRRGKSRAAARWAKARRLLSACLSPPSCG